MILVRNSNGILVGQGIINNYSGDTKVYTEGITWTIEGFFDEGSRYEIFQPPPDYIAERDYFVERQFSAFYNNARGPNLPGNFQNPDFLSMLGIVGDPQFEIKHGLGSSIAKGQWYGMADKYAQNSGRNKATDLEYAKADFHRMRVRAHIQKGLNVINKINGVEVVYKHLANMSIVEPGSQQLRFRGGATEGPGATRRAVYTDLSYPDRYDEVSECFSPPLGYSYSNRHKIDIRHTQHIHNHQKYGHVGYIKSDDESSGGNYILEDSYYYRGEFITLTIVKNTKVYVYGMPNGGIGDTAYSDGSTVPNNKLVYVYVVEWPSENQIEIDPEESPLAALVQNTMEGTGLRPYNKILKVRVTQIGYMGLRIDTPKPDDSVNSRFPSTNNWTPLTITNGTNIDDCAVWLVGCNPGNLALQYPIEGTGQIDTLRYERRIQPRALGLLTTLTCTPRRQESKMTIEITEEGVGIQAPIPESNTEDVSTMQQVSGADATQQQPIAPGTHVRSSGGFGSTQLSNSRKCAAMRV